MSWLALTIGVILGSIASAIIMYGLLLWFFKGLWR